MSAQILFLEEESLERPGRPPIRVPRLVSVRPAGRIGHMPTLEIDLVEHAARFPDAALRRSVIRAWWAAVAPLLEPDPPLVLVISLAIPPPLVAEMRVVASEFLEARRSVDRCPLLFVQRDFCTLLAVLEETPSLAERDRFAIAEPGSGRSVLVRGCEGQTRELVLCGASYEGAGEVAHGAVRRGVERLVEAGAGKVGPLPRVRFRFESTCFLAAPGFPRAALTLTAGKCWRASLRAPSSGALAVEYFVGLGPRDRAWVGRGLWPLDESGEASASFASRPGGWRVTAADGVDRFLPGMRLIA